MPIGVIGAVASLGAGAMQAGAARSAARSQEAAAREQLALQTRVYDETVERFQPFREPGLNALAALNFEMGLGERPDNYGGFQASPGYDWRVSQGMDAVQSSAAARGMLNSGATMSALQEQGQNLASGEYQTWMNRLAGMTDMGMGASGLQATAGANYAQGGSNALANVGNAQAAGAVGAGNAWGGAMQNMGGFLGYMQPPGGSSQPATATGGAQWWNPQPVAQKSWWGG
jgi:hypothetical protein